MFKCNRRVDASTHDRRRRRGTVAAVFGVTLPVVIGVTALALDGGMLYSSYQMTQGAADAAAQAAAYSLFNNYAANQGLDPNGAAAKSATTTAQNNIAGATVVVNIPPKLTTSPFYKKAGYAEVYVTNTQPRCFSALWGPGTMSVTSRAVARVPSKGSGIGLLLLDPSMSGALSQVGNGSTNVTGGSVIVDSSSSSAATLTGNATVTAQNINITGNYTKTGNASFSPTPKTGVTATPDPYTWLTPPDPSTMIGRSYSGGSQTLLPGVYTGGISLTGQASITLSPGIYYLKGGGLSLTGQSSLTGNGVLIYNAPQSSSDGISLTGQGSITLTPMTSGPYANLTIFQDRTSTAPIDLTGNGALSISGTIYAAGAQVSLKGNGNTYGWQIIADSARLTGNGTINVGQPGGVQGLPDMRIVE